jgi:hypothetical protein
VQYLEFLSPENFGVVLAVVSELAVPVVAVVAVVVGDDLLLQPAATMTAMATNHPSRRTVGQVSVPVMRVSLDLDGGRPWPDIVAWARDAGQAGWDGVRVTDREGGRECWSLAGGLAEAVPRIRLTVEVRHNRDRHPAVIAKLASTTDHLTNGRLRLAWVPGDDEEAEPRLAEAVTVIRQLTTQEKTTFAGRYYQLKDAPMDPKPIQIPFPIGLAGTSADLAAKAADEWIISGTQEEIDDQLGDLAAACEKIGRDRRHIKVSARSKAAPAGVDEWIVPMAAIEEAGGARHEALMERARLTRR